MVQKQTAFFDATTPNAISWLTAGTSAFADQLAAITAARHTIRLESYIFADDDLGRRFRDAAVAAARRGVRVRILVDAWGSFATPDAFWEPIRVAGGQVRLFNPLSRNPVAYRNHRKLLICDDQVGFVGGFNLTAVEMGDGIRHGWRDLAVQVTGPLVAELATSFDHMLGSAEHRPPLIRTPRLRRHRRELTLTASALLTSGPDATQRPIKRALVCDFAQAGRIRIIAAYFLPTWSIRRALLRAARRGARIDLILPGKSDVPIAQLAARSQYARFLRAGIRIYEYQPQILHSKFVLTDGAVYVGSANLDPRSLSINYELFLRLVEPDALAAAETVWEEHHRHTIAIDAGGWGRSLSWLDRLKMRLAHLLLARLDPFLATTRWLPEFRW